MPGPLVLTLSKSSLVKIGPSTTLRIDDVCPPTIVLMVETRGEPAERRLLLPGESVKAGPASVYLTDMRSRVGKVRLGFRAPGVRIHAERRRGAA